MNTESIWSGMSRPTHVIGVDPGLLTCGIVTLECGVKPSVSGSTLSVKQKPGKKAERKLITIDTQVTELYRLLDQWFDKELLDVGAFAAVIEAPQTLAKKQVLIASGVVIALLCFYRIPFFSLTPMQARLELGCAVKSEKKGVWAACEARIDGFGKLPTEHTRDAAALALAGILRHERLNRLGLLEHTSSPLLEVRE